ncbi:hypothetical protein ES695_05785 [Candidatus Atribacteria bacterium 1244-E10-H5-B2]|nr:MAG: hypothetical protein ES695_05785 [Candidatus Atribacteria bacterium 1244-E10-H5-B2]
MPEVASVGPTEEEARKENNNIKVSKFPFIANGKALGMGEIEGMVKIIADVDTLELLGVHILGVHASDLIAEVTLDLSMEVTAFEIVNTIHAHPTLAEYHRRSGRRDNRQTYSSSPGIICYLLKKT